MDLSYVTSGVLCVLEAISVSETYFLCYDFVLFTKVVLCVCICLRIYELDVDPGDVLGPPGQKVLKPQK